jgi:WD40 repeat protein
VTELDGNTGAFIRKFPVFTTKNKIDMIKVSPDGKYIISSYDEVNIVNYETGELVKRIPNMGKASIYPDNNRIIGLRYNVGSLDSGLIVYNIINDKFEYYKLDFGYSNLELSPDGKYFATGISGSFQDGITKKNYTILKLWDTETLTEIKTLGKYEGNNDVNYIKFTPDGKYVGFQVYSSDLYIYNTTDFALFKHYGKNNTTGAFGFCFINNDYIALFGTEIIRLNDDKQIFSTYLAGGPYSILEYNKLNNTLIVAAAKLYALDLNKIITTVKDNNPEKIFTVKYSTGILSLDNIQINSTTLNITILDINGKIVKQLDIPNNNGKLEIPMKLNNGTYILNIKDGVKEYSSKFMVTE